MLYDFLLISVKNQEAERIQIELERNRLYRVNPMDKAEQALDYIRAAKVNCVVFNLESFTLEKTTFASHLRYLGYNFPIIIFAKHIQNEALVQLKKIPKTVLIEKPFESKDVWGIADKLVQGKKVHQRIFRRFYTSQDAVLESGVQGSRFGAKIYNMSKGGAYVELETPKKLIAGDVLKLTVPLDKVSKAYTVDVEVVWATQEGFWKGKPAVGVRFMKAGDVYRNLIDKL
jgi:hypothetical protein